MKIETKLCDCAPCVVRRAVLTAIDATAANRMTPGDIIKGVIDAALIVGATHCKPGHEAILPASMAAQIKEDFGEWLAVTRGTGGKTKH